jgi:hypothetical protein
MPGFVLAQALGGAAAFLVSRALYPDFRPAEARPQCSHESPLTTTHEPADCGHQLFGLGLELGTLGAHHAMVGMIV